MSIQKLTLSSFFINKQSIPIPLLNSPFSFMSGNRNAEREKPLGDKMDSFTNKKNTTPHMTNIGGCTTKMDEIHMHNPT
ncbi:hypothetical protein Lalb_Chr18g0050261 [Lupinus albus]|uniref:Uncharacterized protein n=1 Tax=Lupinus albus TaxID=3870 RepID=A0A6A4P647_LUPAL|nr:hypothetical protein Lalb_Chr18g0050261 [Lupinus albus]